MATAKAATSPALPISRSGVSGQTNPIRCASLAFRNPATSGFHQANADDLLRLRDFGAVGLDMAAQPGFAVSPDGSRLAVQVRQAEPTSNTYCQGLLVYDLRRPATRPVTIMLGGELARTNSSLYGMSGFPSGNPRALTPQWSPDGRWLAFVQRCRGHDGLFMVRSAGGHVLPVARPAADVEQFSWAADGKSLAFETDAPLREAEAKLVQEGRGGYRYDERFWMLAEAEPFPRGSFETSRFRVPVGSVGTMMPVRQLAKNTANARPDRAWVDIDDTPRFAYRTRVRAMLSGVAVSCAFAECENAAAAWWLTKFHAVLFLRREGFALSQTGIYRWQPGAGRPLRLAMTDDALTGCALVSRGLLCGRERSASPRDIVEIDAQHGTVRRELDLNPEWHAVAPARITRLHWINRFGIPAIGDLVLPEQVPVGARLPLVVVQYETRGFLRGGTGDEYPIRAIAAAGFAVLSVSRPLDYNTWLARAGKPFSQSDLMENWSDRASVHDSLLKAIDLAGGLVPLDRDHLAITGLSDGASTATYALIHSRVFSLALLSTCCEDPAVTTTAIGPAYQAMQSAYAYPLPWQDHKQSWHHMSLAMNASRICAEIQVQAADREARMALTSLAALRQAGVPIDMYVFPDEYHMKWQSAHRAAIYRRNLEKLVEWRSKPAVSCVSER